MSLVSLDQFLDKYSQYEEVDPSEIDIEGYLEDAETMYCPAKWGKRRVRGIMLLTAHWIELNWEQTAHAASQATQIAAGRAIKVTGNFENDLTLTNYGRQWSNLRNQIPAIPIAT